MRLDTPRIAARLATLTGAAAALLCGIAGTAAGAPAAPATGTVLSAGVAGAITDSYIVMLKPEAKSRRTGSASPFSSAVTNWISPPSSTS